MTQSIPHHEIFVARSQPELLTKSFNPTEEELQFAKKSLIEKHKISNGIQQLLFCKKVDEEQFMSINEKNVIQNQRKKYIDFIKKNYNQKISEELFNINKLKQRIKEFEIKQHEEKVKEEEYQIAKKGGAKVLQGNKRKNEAAKVTTGNKKIKAEKAENPLEKLAPVSKGKKIQPKKEAEKKPVLQLKQLPIAAQLEQNPSSEESLELNLINSLSEEEYANDYE